MLVIVVVVNWLYYFRQLYTTGNESNEVEGYTGFIFCVRPSVRPVVCLQKK